MPEKPQNSVEAMMEILGAQEGPEVMTGAERSAVTWLNSATELFQAAVDNVPALQPFVTKAAEYLSMGISQVIQSGSGLPVSVPPPEEASPPMDEAEPSGGTGPENIPMPGLF